jgi:hypothetical protein
MLLPCLCSEDTTDMRLLQSDRLVFRAEHDDLIETGPVIVTCLAYQMPTVAFHLRMETDPVSETTMYDLPVLTCYWQTSAC